MTPEADRRETKVLHEWQSPETGFRVFRFLQNEKGHVLFQVEGDQPEPAPMLWPIVVEFLRLVDVEKGSTG